MLTTQIAVYLVTGELDRRIASLQMATDTILSADRASRRRRDANGWPTSSTRIVSPASR